jgi:hypothetical protein
MDADSVKEARIRKITHLYYSRPDIQKAIFEFCANRETVPRYFEGFGKRPDTLEYPGDVFQLAKKGATSFHCSEEIWKNPRSLSTELNEEQYNSLREGWDLLIDIDSKYIDYSKIMAELLINTLKFHGVKNLGIKFSGSKGFHIIIPWNSFPKEVAGKKTSEMFPEWPRIITKYLLSTIERELVTRISELARPNKYIKDFNAPKEVIPDLVLVSPRHLFRTPYSLHEKTALASCVIDPNKIQQFELTHANPMTFKLKPFSPEPRENESKELLIQALDWYKETHKEKEKTEREFKPIKLSNLSDKNFPPCIVNILKGLRDGKKRGLFVLINLFRSVGMEKEELETRIFEWNKLNKPKIKDGYIKSQLMWSFKHKLIMPPNCKEFYQGVAVCEPDAFCSKVKNPVNYTIRKCLIEQNKTQDKPQNKTQNKKQ